MIGKYLDGLQHLGLPTASIEQTVLFYSDLGFEVVYRTIVKGTQQVAFLKLGNLLIETYTEASAKKDTGCWDHIALSCLDIDEAFAYVQQKGFKIVSDGVEFLPFWENGVRFFIIEGPNCERVEFNQKL